MRQVRILLIAIIIIASLFGGGCATKPVRETVHEPVAAPEPAGPEVSVTMEQPETVWQSQLDTKEVDIATFVGADGFLIRTVDLELMGTVWALKNRDLIFYNLENGSVRWRYSYEKLPANIDQVVAGSSAVYVTGVPADERDVLLAIDIQSGQPIWERKGDSKETSIKLFPLDGIALFTTPHENELTITGVNIEDGKDKWTSTLSNFLSSKAVNYGIRPLEGDFLILGKRIVRMKPDTGKTVWEASFSGYEREAFMMELEGSSLVLMNGRNVLCLAPDTGEIKWQIETPGIQNMLIHLVEGRLFLAGECEGGSVVKRLDPISGKAMWEKKVEEKLRSPLFYSNGCLYFTTKEWLYALEEKNAQQRFRAELPESLRSPVGLPDQIVVVEDRIIVSREVGVAAFSSSSGSPIYHHVVGGALPFTNAFLAHKLAVRLSARSSPDMRLAVIGSAASGLAAQTANSMRAISQMNLQYTMMNTQPVLSSSTSSSSDRMLAITQREVAIETNYAMELASATTQLTSATVGLATSMMNLLMTLHETYIRASMDLNKVQTQNSLKTYSRNIQKGYYLRPFYDNGWGVTLVRLADGKRADIYTSPDNEALRINAANLPLFLISPDGKRLITKGIGPNPKEFYTMRACPANAKLINDKVTIPYPSIMVYELEKIPFSDEGGRGSATISWKVPDEMGQELLQAVFSPDLNKVKSLISQGANVNVVDHYGLNALFYASLVDDKKLVKLLIDNGCDGKLRDAHGWLAWHYNGFTIPGSKSIFLLGNAANKP